MEFYNKRFIKLLNIFLQNPNMNTGDSIALTIGVSKRTVRNDIKKINELIVPYDAEIISEIGQGYYLKIKDQEHFNDFLKQIDLGDKANTLQNIIPTDPKERINYIITKLLFRSLVDNTEYMDEFDLAEELYVSQSTLKKDFKTVSDILSSYDLKMKYTKKEGLRITGDEAKMRYCISEYLFRNKKYVKGNEKEFHKKLFSPADEKRTKEILIRAISQFGVQLTDMAFQNLLIHVLIMLKRFEKEKSVEYNQEDISLFISTKEFECARVIVTKMKKEMGLDLGDEVYYLTQHLISSQRYLIENPSDDYEYKEEIEKILGRIKQGTGIDFFDDKQLINGLDMHLSVALQRLRFDMNIRNEFLDSIKNSYPLAFELAVLAGEVIKENHHFKANENEIGFLAMHFGAALERQGLNREIACKKVIIVCITGVATAMLLKEKIKSTFPQRIQVVKTCPTQELTQEMINQVDLVLTTVDLPEFDSAKIKKIHLFLNDTDIDAINNAINDYSGGLKIDYQDIIRKDLFFSGKDFSSRDEALDYITGKMMEKGYITEDIRRSVFKREEISTTELGSLLAIPHALINDMNEAAVSVTILNKPVIWEKEKVQVILLLNIPKSKYNIWENVFKNLYQYLISDYGVAKLIRNADYEELMDDLAKQERKNY